MIEVKDLHEARRWFLTHCEGSIVCVEGTRRAECKIYSEAEKFYSEKPVEDSKPVDNVDKVDQTDQLEPWTMCSDVADLMEAQGGSFVKAIAKAWFKADNVNKEKLVNAFPYFAEYSLKLAELKDKPKEESQ